MSSPSQSVEEQQIHGSGVVFEDPLPLDLTPIHIEPPFNPDLDPADCEDGGGQEQEQQNEPEEQKQESPPKPLIQMGVNPKVVPPIAGPDVRVSVVRRVTRYNCRKRRRAPHQRKNGKTSLRDPLVDGQKLETLKVNFNPIPFIPVKILDFSKREKLLRKLGLWDFVHIDFDRNIRADLIGQLVVTYEPKCRCAHIDNFRIHFNRCNYADAFKLPRSPTARKQRGIGVEEAEVLDAEDVSEDSIGFILEFVSDWVLLHEDAWMTPSEVTNWLKLIKEGRPDMVDWAGLIKFMVENELRQGVQLRDCYYASHIQYLLKCQRESLFTMEEDLVAEKLEVEAETKAEEKEINEEHVMAGNAMVDDEGEKSCVVEAPSIELTLGQDGEKEDNMQDVEMADVEKCKVDDDGGDDVNDHDDDEVREELDKEQGEWLLHGKNNLGEHFLQPCRVKDGQGFGNLDNEAGQSFANLEDGKDDEVEETEADGSDQIYDTFPAVNGLDGEGLTGNFLQAMEANQVAFNSQERLHDPSSVNTRDDDMQCMDPSASFFNPSGKRVIEHDNGIDHHSLNDSNKRLRINESWNHKPRDFKACMEQIQQLAATSTVFFEEREQALEQGNMNQQILLNELQKRDSLIEHLHKSRMEEMQKKDGLIYRLERELYLVENVMNGYRKALKETQSAFAEYRLRAQLTEEPTYKDAGPGGLMLSTTEIEKLRQKREEEYKMNCLLVEQKFKEAEENYMHEFDAYVDKINILDKKLTNVEADAKELIQSYGTRKLQPTEGKVDEALTPHPTE
ncbi:uncharacterized protein [Henckelia pumila]|uniref:uncharacterized protein n=1 Tax=Henckelia pumila TaxID=405737 RepID=UPI003C6DEA12